MSSALCSGTMFASRKSFMAMDSRSRPSYAALNSFRELEHRGFTILATASKDTAQDTDTSSTMSGEWPANLYMASYEDISQYFQDNIFKDDAPPGSLLQDIMSTNLTVTTPGTSLEELKAQFGTVSGLPVVESKSSMVLIGVVSRKDLLKAGNRVSDIMSTPPVSSGPDKRVADAACLMLKYKVHRIPVVDHNTKVVGIVTRTDIFTALALKAGTPV